MLPSDYFALQAWRTKYTILEAGVKWSQSNDVCLLVTKILVAGLRRCVGCLLVGWFSESRIRNWQKTWLAMFTLAVFDESLKKEWNVTTNYKKAAWKETFRMWKLRKAWMGMDWEKYKKGCLCGRCHGQAHLSSLSKKYTYSNTPIKYTSTNTQIQEVSQEHKGRSQQTLATKL